MDEDDPLIERLRGLGRGQIDPGVAGRHLGAMAGVQSRTNRFVKLKVGAAFAAGLVFGGTGLASAGVLPASVQDAAHGALSQVGVSVPNGHAAHKGHGPARYNGPECTGGPYANHGQYVRVHKSDPNAGASRCGKPVHAGRDATNHGTEAPKTPEAPGAPGSPGSAADDQGGKSAGTHGGHGHGKPATAPSPGRTAPAPLSPSTTVTLAPADQAPSSPTSTSTSTSTVEPTTTSTSSTTAPSP